MPLTLDESQKMWKALTELIPQKLWDEAEKIVRQYTAQTVANIEEVKKLFPNDLEPLFNFEDKGEYIKVTPRQYLGSENFAKAAQIVRSQLQGDYVSAGKDSHFRIPKKVEK